MKIYSDRFSQEYISVIQNKMSIEELKKNAIQLKNPRVHKDIVYTRLIRIDYIGIAAAVLFDEQYAYGGLYSQVEKLLEVVEELNRQGYFVKFRILLEYPYSITSYSRILAELTDERASVDESEYLRDFMTIHSGVKKMGEQDVLRSYLCTSQIDMLKSFNSVYEKYVCGNENWRNGLNKFTLRFIPFDPMMSCLVINRDVFYSVYMLAKQKRSSNRLLHKSPVVYIDSLLGHNADAVNAFEDHFRYLWCLGITMDSEDVFEDKQNWNLTLVDIRRPEDIRYEKKARRIREEGRLKSRYYSEAEEEEWRFYMKNALQYFCAPIYALPNKETLFISCGWHMTAIGQSAYDDEVNMLKEWLIDDFTENNINLLNVELVDVRVGGGIHGQLYKSLDKATMGLVMMDIKMRGEDGKCYSSPNVYHELGYLMGRVKPGGMIILREKKRENVGNKDMFVEVQIPSNIQNISNITYEKGSVLIAYHDIVWKICDHCFSGYWFDVIMKKHQIRLTESLKSGKIEHSVHEHILKMITRQSSWLKNKSKNSRP